MWLGEKNAYTFGRRGNSLKTSISKPEEVGWVYYDVQDVIRMGSMSCLLWLLSITYEAGQLSAFKHRILL